MRKNAGTVDDVQLSAGTGTVDDVQLIECDVDYL
jgi:hypothetical protein